MSGSEMAGDEMRQLLDDVIHEATGVRAPLDGNFFDCGLTSESLVKVLNALNAKLALELPIEALFKYPNRRSLARHLVTGGGVTAGLDVTPAARPTGTAVPSIAQARRDLRARIRDRER